MNLYNIDVLAVCFDSTGRIIYNISQAYMVAYLCRKMVDAEVYVSESILPLDRLTEEMLDLKPRCIFFYCHDQNYLLVREAVKRIMVKRQETVSLIATGPAAMYSSDILLQMIPGIDACIKSDNEDEIYRFILHIINKSYVPVIKQSDDLDIYPSLYLSGIIDPIKCQKLNKMIVLNMSRGCPMKCKFCKFSAMNGRFIRKFSIDHVVNEIKFLLSIQKSSGIIFDIKFMDEFFTIDRERVLQFCKRVIEEGLCFKFSIHARADFMDNEMLIALSNAGCYRISYGLETAVPHILEEMGKSASGNKYIEKFRKTVLLTKQNGIAVAVNAIYGWRTETREEAERTLDFIEELAPDRYEHCVLTYYRGTEAYNEVSGIVGDRNLSLKYYTFPILYKYNPYTLRHLPFDKIYFCHQNQRTVIQSMMGLGFQEEDLYQVLISFINDMTYEWLAHSIPPATKIIFMQDNIDNETAIYFAEEAFAGEAYDDIGCFIPEHISVSKKLINSQNAFKCIESESPNLLTDLPDMMSLMGLLTESQSLSQKQCIHYFGKQHGDILIKDFCKIYGKRGCRACSLKRIIIGKDYKLYTCFHGKSIGEIWELPQRALLKERIETAYEDMLERRKCKNCTIYTTCPKCLWPGEIAIEDYCAIQRGIKQYGNMSLIYKTIIMKYCYNF